MGKPHQTLREADVWLGDAQSGSASATGRERGGVWRSVGEALVVLASPVVIFFVLRLRPMAPQYLPDPAFHTIYIVDPRDVFTRYWGEYASWRFREAARVGFLVPARIAYLLFGGVPGFFVMRYLLALVAAGPTYLLLRRAYGVAAGVLGLIVMIGSPVLVTAWGTDYPDSAAVSYLAGGLSCLAMPSRARSRPFWVALAGALFTLALWSHAASLFLVAATLVAYVILSVLRDFRHLLRDVAIMAGAAVLVTGLLEIGAVLVLGESNLVPLTLAAWSYSNSPRWVAQYHSTSWAWAPDRVYLLVLPAVVGAYVIAFARRLRTIATSQLLVGLVLTAQVAVAAYIQFFWKVEMLEMRYLSSLVWGAVCVGLAVTLAELARPLLESRVLRWLPAFLAVAVPLVYEADRHLPAERWVPAGVVILATALVAALIGRLLLALPAGFRRGGMHADPSFAGSTIHRLVAPGVAVAIGALVGSTLILTVIPVVRTPITRGISRDDVPSSYDTALGGSGAVLVDRYRIATEIPHFVGNATYQGEQLMTWSEVSDLVDYLRIYHDRLNFVPNFPVLTRQARLVLDKRRPAELLFAGNTTADFGRALHALAPYSPALDRAAELSSGPVHLHLWLVSLRTFERRARA